MYWNGAWNSAWNSAKINAVQSTTRTLLVTAFKCVPIDSNVRVLSHSRIEFTLTHKQTKPLTHTPFIAWMYLIYTSWELCEKKGTSHKYMSKVLNCKWRTGTHTHLDWWKYPTPTFNTCKNAWLPTWPLSRLHDLFLIRILVLSSFSTSFSFFFFKCHRFAFVSVRWESLESSLVWINLCKHQNYVVEFELSTCSVRKTV